MRPSLAWAFAVGLGLGVAGSCGGGGQDCPVGGEACPCTEGGACDPGLSCLSNVCVALDPGTEEGGPSTSAGTTASTEGGTSAGTMTTGVDDTTGGGADGPKLDVRSDDTGIGPAMGCSAIDMLFVLDSSASMSPERQALAATDAFTQIVTILEGLNRGGIQYRIGVTNDNDDGFFVPGGWNQPDPWFDSEVLGTDGVVQAFNGAVGQITGEPPLGCEHVLTSATDLLDGDPSGFVRADALLVLVLLTDVDDYGAYDQQGGNICGLGCATAPDPVADLTTRLVDDVKGGQMDGLAAIVIAGDPNIAGGMNFCNQPGTCCGGGDCSVFHADRLWQFAGMLGANGYTSNLCNTSAPDAVETALTASIDLACMSFDPEG
jgi:hypothetical protein